MTLREISARQANTRDGWAAMFLARDVTTCAREMLAGGCGLFEEKVPPEVGTPGFGARERG